MQYIIFCDNVKIIYRKKFIRNVIFYEHSDFINKIKHLKKQAVPFGIINTIKTSSLTKSQQFMRMSPFDSN